MESISFPGRIDTAAAAPNAVATGSVHPKAGATSSLSISLTVKAMFVSSLGLVSLKRGNNIGTLLEHQRLSL
jgi:hypothetical protein